MIILDKATLYGVNYASKANTNAVKKPAKVILDKRVIYGTAYQPRVRTY